MNASPGDYDFLLTFEDATIEPLSGELKGTMRDALVPPLGEVYVLSLVDGVVTFCKALLNYDEISPTFKNNANKAYLELESSLPSEVGSNIRLDIGIAASVDGVNAQSVERETVYDLQGRKVETPSKGMYIVNGKKVFLR